MDYICHTHKMRKSNRISPVDRKINARIGQRRETRYAVLVNDMLDDFVHGNLRSNRALQIVPRLRALLDAARAKDIPIFYCNDEHEISDPEIKIWGPHAIKFTPGSRVIHELEPQPTDFMFSKRSYGSFANTSLEKLLRSIYEGQGANTLIITGIHTHLC